MNQQSRQGMSKRRRTTEHQTAPWKASRFTLPALLVCSSASALHVPLVPATGSGNEPERDFKTWILQQYADGFLAAKQTCIGCWHLGDLAEQVRVDHIARSPTCQSGSFAHFSKRKLGIDTFVRNSVFFTKNPTTHQEVWPQVAPAPFFAPTSAGRCLPK